MSPNPDRFRRTARETFNDCARRYWGEYLAGVSTENDATRRGSVFHEARAAYILSLAKTKQVSDHEMAQAAWTRAITSHPLPTKEYHDARMLWQAWTERYELNLKTFYSAEQKVWCEAFNCWIRMDETHAEKNTFIIVDAKTHWRVPDPMSLKDTPQTGMYLAAARMLYPGFDAYELRYDFVRSNVGINVTLTDAEMDAWIEWVKESDEAIDMATETNQWPATPGSHCAYCRVSCPIADHPESRPVRFLSPDEAQAAIERIAVRERANQMDKDALRAYTEEHGPTAQGGIEWAHRPQVRASYDAQDVIQILNEFQRPIPRFMLSATSMKPLDKAIKADAKLRKALEFAKVEKTTTTFGQKAVGGEDTPQNGESV